MLDQLVGEISGKPLSVTGLFLPGGIKTQDAGQCTAVAHAWEKKLGLPLVYGDAKDTLGNAPDTHYTREFNNPDNHPLPGAIIVWGPSWGSGAGHTAVVLDANVTGFHVVEQNNPVGSAVHTSYYANYSGVIGWFTPNILIGKGGGQVYIDPTKLKDLEDWKNRATAPGAVIVQQSVLDDLVKWKNDGERYAQSVKQLQDQVRALEQQIVPINNPEPVNVPVTNLDEAPEHVRTYIPAPHGPYVQVTTQEAFAADMTGSHDPVLVKAGTPVEVAGHFESNGRPYARSQTSVDAEKDPNHKLHGSYYGLPQEAFAQPEHEVPISFEDLAVDNDIDTKDKLVNLVADITGPLLRYLGSKRSK